MKDCFVFNSSIVQLIGPIPKDDKLPGRGYLITAIGTQRGSCRGRGDATTVMQHVLNEADDENAYLYLSVQPDPDTDYDRLTRWYQKLGFVHVPGEPNAMYRVPNRYGLTDNDTSGILGSEGEKLRRSASGNND